MADEDKFQTAIANLRGLAQALTEAPVEEGMLLSAEDLRNCYVQALALHAVVGATLLTVCNQLEKYR